MTISLDAVAPDHHRITGPREPAKLDADHVRGVDRHSWNFGVCGDAVSTVMGALPQGEILDMLVQRRRDTRAALRLMRKLVRKQGFAPKLLVTDKLRSYASAFRRLRLSCRHEQGLRSIELPHRADRRTAARTNCWRVRLLVFSRTQKLALGVTDVNAALRAGAALQAAMRGTKLTAQRSGR